MTKPQILVLNEKQVDFTLFAVKWVPCSSRLVALGSHPRGTGVLQIYGLTKGKLELVKETKRADAIKCGTFNATSFEERHLATGDFKGNLVVYDLENLEKPVYSANGHSSIINDIDGVGGLNIGKGTAELVTGSRDGTVKVWDVRQKDKPVAVLEPSEGHGKHDCWAVAFGSSYNASERWISAGFENGDLKIFDLKAMKVYWETNVEHGVCSIEFDRRDIEPNKLTVCTLDSRILVYDLTVQHPTKGFACARTKAHKSTVWCGKHLPQNRDVFVTSGGNGSLCLWQYEYPSNRSTKGSDGKLEGVPGNLNLLNEVGVAEQPITSFSWNADHLGLGASSSFDQTIRVYGVTKLNCI